VKISTCFGCPLAVRQIVDLDQSHVFYCFVERNKCWFAIYVSRYVRHKTLSPECPLKKFHNKTKKAKVKSKIDDK